MAMLVKHEAGCPRDFRTPLGGHSDAAFRISDQWNLHRVAAGREAIGKWFAAKLADGTSDGVLYDTQADAIRHQHHNEVYYAFFCIAPTNMPVCDAEVALSTYRQFYDAGARWNGDDDVRRPVFRQQREDQVSLTRAISGKGAPTNLIIPSRHN